MCGICGAFAPAGGDVDPAAVRRMSATLVHRGPDHEAIHVAPGAVLGVRRLAVLDPTPAGHPPYTSDDDTIVALLNGELYNHRALQAEVVAAGRVLRSRCDAELVPHLYAMHGDDFLERLEGMFALAVLDRRRHRLLLARDRAGEKPLYWCADGGVVRFASAPRALLASGAVTPALDAGAVARYLAFAAVPGARSLFSGLRRLPPGGRLVADAAGVRVDAWHVPPAVAPAVALDAATAARETFAALVAATAECLDVDVPAGVLLSGGIDSGLVLAAARIARPDVVTDAFTLGFADPEFDERPLAAATARHLGARHHVAVAPPPDASLLDELAAAFDEPLGDPSAWPTLLLCRHARRRVTVALGGDGGDEGFAGYPRHRAAVLAERLAGAPRPLRRALARLLGEPANGVAGRGAAGRLRRLLAPLGGTPEDAYLYWVSWFRAPLRARFLHPDLRAAAAEADPDGEARAALCGPGSLLRRALRFDRDRYLPDDLLLKMDTASMAAGLEVRAPFLDRRVTTLAARLPDHLLVRGRRGKVLLRRLAAEHLPAAVARASKRGFGVPLAAWLRGPLHGLLQDRLLGPRFAGRRILEPGAAAELIARHRSGREDWSLYLWLLLVLDAWCRRFLDREEA